MKLGELLKDAGVIYMNADPEMEVDLPRYDSRMVSSGDVFVAIEGFEQDGNRFIPSALEKGAVCCVTQTRPREDIPYVLVSSARRALAVMAANRFGHPAKKLKMIGVTGTNGKTTVTYLLASVLERVLGAKVGLIGTTGNRIGDLILPSERTTPESSDLQELLARMADEGCEYVVMEVSSHALCLDRVAAIGFKAGIFTNLTQDHLDFHVTMDNYLEAKSRLFSICEKGIINADDSRSGQLLSLAKCSCITYSPGGKNADVFATDHEMFSDSVSYTFNSEGEKLRVKVPIPGQFTVENSLAVLSCCKALGIDTAKAAKAISSAKGVPGRMEVVPGCKGFTALIDYAHTPDALENVLKAARKIARGRVSVLFGCGGDRDRTKRPIMGELGVRLADFAYITSDNPRTEDPQAIIDDIVAGVKEPKERWCVICDRREAIKTAILNAEENEILILAGKGHETYQIIGKEKTHLDEREEVAAALELRG